jgi:DNA replication protein DnaC
MPYRDVVRKIKQNILSDDAYSKLINKYQRCDVLVIDDLYKGKINETDVNIVFEIINYRYLNYLPMIISTEFNTTKLLSFDEAIGSRIYEMCKDYIIEIQSGKENNYRLRQ